MKCLSMTIHHEILRLFPSWYRIHHERFYYHELFFWKKLRKAFEILLKFRFSEWHIFSRRCPNYSIDREIRISESLNHRMSLYTTVINCLNISRFWWKKNKMKISTVRFLLSPNFPLANFPKLFVDKHVSNRRLEGVRASIFSIWFLN